MANTKELRRRIRSVKNTAQITKAMQMVSATKMRRAQNLALSSKPYTVTLSSVLHFLFSALKSYNESEIAKHYLMTPNRSSRVGVVLFSTDKGLCGALNNNLFRFLNNSTLINQKLSQGQFSIFTVGKKGRNYAVKLSKKYAEDHKILEADFENPEHVNLEKVNSLRKYVINLFQKGEIGEVYLLYPSFVSTIKQEPTFVKILPIDLEQLSSFVSKELGASEESVIRKDLILDQNKNDLLDFALSHFIEVKIYQAFLETKASEHSARMIAMQNATNNAKELVEDLTLTYNQLRQESITKEILEISSASAVLE